MRKEQEDPFRSLEDVAEQLNISFRSARRKLDEGELPGYKFGRLVRFRQSDIDAYIERSRRDDAAPVEPTPHPKRRRTRKTVAA